VVLLDENEQVLLVRFVYRGGWWCAPGAGLENGKTQEDAARR
jgi:8-oxo-dGTP pyrophosphatase MutT (NUDIX family)